MHNRRRPQFAGMVAAALGPLVTGVVAHAEIAVTTGALGWDISWPQCGHAFPGGSGSDLRTVGVTAGHPFSTNPCLGPELSWASGATIPYSVYINLNWPTASSLPHAQSGPKGSCSSSDDACLGYNYGWNAAADAVAAGHAAGVTTSMWWLDVETGDHWSNDTTGNAAVIQGAIDELRAQQLMAGVYSITFMWNQIAGSGYTPGVPVWVPGPESIDWASYYCSPSHSFTGGPVWVVQFSRSGYDGDMACGPEPQWPPRPSWSVQGHGFGPLGGPPQVVSPNPGNLDVFWRGTDDMLWHAWELGGTWYGPQNLGGPLASDPDPVVTTPGVIDVFWLGTDRNLWHSWYNRGWNGPASLGDGPLGSSPQAAAPGGGTVDVFWRGTDDNIWHAYWGTSWGPPTMLAQGSPGDGPPMPVSSAAGLVDVFYRGADNNLWDVFYNHGWSGPVGLQSGPLGSDPRPLGWGTGHIEVFWQGTDDGAWERIYTPADGWIGPRSIVTSGLTQAPSPASWGPGDSDIYWVGSDGNLWHHSYGISTSLGGRPIASAPSVAAPTPGQTAVFWKGTDLNLWEAVYS